MLCRIQVITNAGGNCEAARVQYDWKILAILDFTRFLLRSFFQNAVKALIKRKWFTEQHSTWLNVLAMFGGRGKLKLLCNIKQETEASLNLQKISNHTQQRTKMKKSLAST